MYVSLGQLNAYQCIFYTGNHDTDINHDAASRPRDDGPTLTVNCDLIGQLTETETDDGIYILQ